MDNKPNISDENLTKLSADAARGVVGSGVPGLTNPTLGPSNKLLINRPSGRKKGIILLATFLITAISLSSFFLFFRDDYYASAENWPLVDDSTGLRAKPAELLIKEGKLKKPEKIVEVNLAFDSNSSNFSIKKVYRKNGFVKNTTLDDSSWKVELRDASDKTLSEAYFSRSVILVEKDEETTSKEVKDIPLNESAVKLKWEDAAEKVALINPKGELIAEQGIKQVKHVENKPNFYSVTGNEIKSKKKSSLNLPFLNNKVNAQSNNGVLDLVFIPQGYSLAEMYKYDGKVSKIISALQTVEPYKSRFSNIRINSLRITQDFGCKGPNIGGQVSTFMYCNWQGGDIGGFYTGTYENSVKAYLNNNAIPFDRVLVIKNNDIDRGGTGSYPESGWFTVITSIDSKLINLALHELSHTFGALDEYTRTGKVYTTTSTTSTSPYSPALNTEARNCFAGPPAGIFIYAGCGTYTNWSRTSLNSTMNAYPDTPNFNPLTQKIILSFMDKYIDTSPPTVSIAPVSTAPITQSTTTTSSSTGSTLNTSLSSTATTITVNAADNVGIKKVDLYSDGVLYSSKTTAPYSFSWDKSKIKILGRGPVASGSTYSLQITGRANIPVGAGYVVANLTTVNPVSGGYITVYPCDETRPSTSNVNFRTGEISNGSVISRLSANGTVCLYTSTTTDIIFDINGYYPGGAEYVALSPAKRLIDTRSNGDGINASGNEKAIQIAGISGVPASVDAVNINITAVGATSAGSLWVYPCGESRPTNSYASYTTVGAYSSTALAKLGKDGKVCVYSSSSTHLIVDISGYYTQTGKFVPRADTPLLVKDYSVPGNSVTQQFSLVGSSGYLSGAKGINGIISISNAKENGNLVIFPCDKPTQDTITPGSLINYTAGVNKSTIFNTGISGTGSICFKSIKQVSISIVAVGYFGSNSSFVSLPSSRLLDTRKGNVVQATFQKGVRELFATAYDFSGRSSTSSIIKLTF